MSPAQAISVWVSRLLRATLESASAMETCEWGRGCAVVSICMPGRSAI